MNHPNARVAIHSCINEQILQEKMSHMHGGKPGKIPLMQGEQISGVGPGKWSRLGRDVIIWYQSLTLIAYVPTKTSSP
ncbi:hypothetical protein D8674_014598 [Pyrus ussuriensis x Pyrus communis]|uniref:Uncharacterized protein n=1 Tax=Pyrus ussuriensis x Pyrus communis TaxID=2448454 RepID=A0A5N5GT27_9ROSA|nr:hypothetical protein D8674_014598 [Pyrus ussuriensis x Pyrus communis]